MVREFSRISSFKTLYSGLRFVALAKFLWQPYECRTTLSKYHPAADARHHEPFPLAMTLNWQEESGRRAQQFSLSDELDTVNKSASSMVVLKGYPSAKWLNALGAKFRNDPDFYQRHLCFWSESGNSISRQNMAPRLPSAQEETIMLRIPTIGVLTGGWQPTRRGAVQDLDSHQMVSGMIPGDSMVREFVMLDLNHFAIEQAITINVASIGNGGWQIIVWSDAGRSLDEGFEGPWRLRMPRKSSEMTYQLISIYRPRMALSGGWRSRKDSATTDVRPQSASILFDDYDRHLNNIAQAAADPLYALSPIFSFALFSEMALLDTLESNIRSELTHSAVTAQESPTMSNLLYIQQILKRHIESLKEVIDFVEAFRKQPAYQSVMNSAGSTYAEEMTSMLEDFRAALRRAEALCDECFQGIGIVAHNATIRESQKAFAEARSVTKLTKLALVFVPLSFTTSAFGMNVKELGPRDIIMNLKDTMKMAEWFGERGGSWA
ncbi:hypothetical protein PG994_005382 [Apiospora phragmitis]|uniref:Uncharacterized protein n=1 Tax=Apiospora phragmitis TaxID=2905665 RepID=A0ABR1VEL7_9PEZI